MDVLQVHILTPDVVVYGDSGRYEFRINYVSRSINSINPLTAKLFNLNFHPLEVQVSVNYSDLKMEVNCFQILLIDVTFYIYHV